MNTSILSPTINQSALYRTPFTATVLLLGAFLFCGPLAANQNAVLKKFESAPANWTQPVVSTALTDNSQPAAVALGQPVSIQVSSNEPAAFILAIVNTYGDVRIEKSDTPSLNATYEFTATAPVGQYSVFSFATNPAIANSVLGIPDGKSSHQLAVGMQSVDQLINTIASASASGQVAKGAEFQFSVEDSNLAMRGIRKQMKRMKDNKKKPRPVAKQPTQPTIVAAPVIKETPAPAPEQPAVVAAVQEVVEPAETEMVLAAADTAVNQVELVEIKASPVTTTTTEQSESTPDSLSLDIKFALNSDTLTPTGVNALDTLGSALLSFQRSGDLPTIMLEGHTDDTGSADYNLVLSEKRANSARKYLLERFDLPDNSVMSAGFGETAPKVLERTLEGRRANRRVELRVVQ